MTATVSPIDVINVRKSFGKKQALSGISFKLDKNMVFGLVGPNGAGKTTLIRIISGIITKFEGEVKVNGLAPNEARNRGYISYLPEDASPYERLTGIENLEFYARIYSKGEKKEIEDMLERGIKIANLGNKIYEMTSTYSRGMRRRLLIARTLMTNSPIALLDEPLSGLDVESAVKIRKMIKDIGKKGESTILFSSHDMLEIELLCDFIVMINQGRVVAQGSPKEIRELFSAGDLEEAFIKAVGAEL